MNKQDTGLFFVQNIKNKNEKAAIHIHNFN